MYLGGKFKISPRFAPIINKVAEGRTLWEPFCGGLNASHRFKPARHILSDVHEPLITMWRAALKDGWRPNPELATREMYNRYRQSPDTWDPWTAFLGFGCSFSGRYFCGYVGFHCIRRDAGVQWVHCPTEAANSLLRTERDLKDRETEILHLDFMTCDVPDGVDVVYCDPPYEGTTRYRGTAPFDHDSFWERCREIGATGIHVFVSEKRCPDDFAVLWTGGKKHLLKRNGRGQANDVMHELLCYTGPGMPSEEAECQQSDSSQIELL